MSVRVLLSVAAAFAVIIAPLSAEASEFIGMPSSVSVEARDTFDVTITINPLQELQYTAKLAIDFSPETIEVVSFALDPAWIPLAQPGYDLVDNDRGLLVKTAGFPQGFSDARTFGTVTFRARESGNGIVSIASSSFVLNADGENSLRSRSQTRVLVQEAPIVVPRLRDPAEPIPSAPTEQTETGGIAPTEAPPPEEDTTLFDVVSTPAEQPEPRPLGIYALMIVLGAGLAMAVHALVSRRTRRRSSTRIPPRTPRV